MKNISLSVTVLPWCLVVASPVFAMHLIQPIFTREECERALLSERANLVRAEVIKGLHQLDGLTLEPNNSAATPVNLADHDPAFAEFQLGPDATDDDVEDARARALARRAAAYAGQLASPPAVSTTATDLQAAALGLRVLHHGPIDQMAVHVRVNERGHLSLETAWSSESRGEIELDLATFGLGYEGDIELWTYNQLTGDGGRLPPIGAAQFLNDQAVAILRPTHGPSRFAFVVSFFELQEFDDQGHLEIHVYAERDCDPNVALGGRVHAVPFHLENGRARCFAPTGLRLRTLGAE